MLTQTTYKIEQYDLEWGVIETTLKEPDWKETKKVIFHGNLSDAYAYMRLKEKGQI